MLRSALRWIADQLAFLMVLLVLGVAFCYLLVEPDGWGPGSKVISVGMLLAGLLRTVLPPGRAGLLAVRSRWLDAAFYVAVGGLILAVDIRLHA